MSKKITMARKMSHFAFVMNTFLKREEIDIYEMDEEDREWLIDAALFFYANGVTFVAKEFDIEDEIPEPDSIH